MFLEKQESVKQEQHDFVTVTSHKRHGVSNQFVQQVIQVNNNETSKLRITGLLCGGIHQWP